MTRADRPILPQPALVRETGAVPVLQIDQVDPPIAGDAAAVAVAVRLLGRAQVVGALPATVTGGLGPDLLGRALAGLREAGIGAARAEALAAATTAADCTLLLTAVDDALELTPLPAGTWVAVVEVLGAELVAELLGVPAGDVERHRDGLLPTTGPVARRLHVVALLVADLAGTYDDSGIARWFIRPRRLLDGSTPLEALRSDLDVDGLVDGPAVAQVRRLVAGLAAMGAT